MVVSYRRGPIGLRETGHHRVFGRLAKNVKVRNLPGRLRLPLLISAAAVLSVLSSTAFAATWTVTGSKGVVLSLVAGEWQEVELGTALVDPTLRSLRGARLELRLAGTTLELGPDSAVRLGSRPGGAVTVQHYAGTLEVTGNTKEQVLVQAGGVLVANIAGSVDVKVSGAITTVLVEAGNASVRLADNGFVSVSAGHLATGNDDSLTVAGIGAPSPTSSPRAGAGPSGQGGQGDAGGPSAPQPMPSEEPQSPSMPSGNQSNGPTGNGNAAGPSAPGNSEGAGNAGTGNPGNNGRGNGAAGNAAGNGNPPGPPSDTSEADEEPANPGPNGPPNGNGPAQGNPGNGAANGNGSGNGNGNGSGNGNGNGNGNGPGASNGNGNPGAGGPPAPGANGNPNGSPH
jgi:hypothetical protein